MTSKQPPAASPPIDAVIAWVDGDDPRLAQKRSNYVHGTNVPIGSGAHSTRFASSNEIRYCVLSVLRFAPYIRNIFIVTDEQDPDIYNDVRKYFPERLASIRIVDHKEIFEGYESCLPTFNSISIANMIWRIKGLSENFVYFNDDTFLIRDMKPEEWFVDGRPVLRGRWVPATIPELSGTVSKFYSTGMFSVTRILNQGLPSIWVRERGCVCLDLSSDISQTATRHTQSTGSWLKSTSAKTNSLLKKNISFRFRDHSQFTFISLSNHLQLLDGNRHIAGPALAYLKPQDHAEDYVDKKIALCESHPGIRFLCIQSLEMCRKEDREKLFGWLDRKFLEL